jgi:Transposase DDE domain
MLTSVLDRRQLTVPIIVRYYKMRWGIEVEFRGLKQTLDRSKLRCRNDQRLLAELDWSILAMAVAELFAWKEQQSQRRLKSGEKPHPLKRSLANTMRALRGAVRHGNEVPKPGEDLASLLREAVTDSYQRQSSKKARYRPPNPDKKPLGNPKVRPLSQRVQKKLAQLNE